MNIGDIVVLKTNINKFKKGDKFVIKSTLTSENKELFTLDSMDGVRTDFINSDNFISLGESRLQKIKKLID